VGIVNVAGNARKDLARVASNVMFAGMLPREEYWSGGEDDDEGRALPGQIGIANFAAAVRGFQIGIYNETDDLGGVQIGLVNVSKKHGLPWSVLVNAGF
jgi:hypothetical protein